MTANSDRNAEPTHAVWHPVLRTSRDELAETCRDRRHTEALEPGHADQLAGWIEAAPETLLAQIALRAGQFVIEGFDYFDALVLAAERFFKGRPPR